MVHQRYFSKIYILILVLSAHTVKSQQHHMMSANSKNVYLSIMDTMMVEMDKSSGGSVTEADFINQMIPHHKGAIEMAKYEIKNGRDFSMIQLAKSILHEQTIELQQMNIWITQPFVSSTPASSIYLSEMKSSMETMMQKMPTNDKLNDTDKAFAMVMLPHHRAAVDMAKTLLKYTNNTIAASFAKHLISSEQIEIEQMQLFIN